MHSDIPDGFEPATFTGEFLDQNGPYYLKRDGTHWLVGQQVADNHLNYMGVAHGGMLSTLADVALSLQPFLSEIPNPAVNTASLTVNYIASARQGDWIVAETQMDRIGSRSAQVSGRILRGREVLATMSGVFSLMRSGGD
jgi:uncharacterized protein (TIGR00369 family)